MSRLSTETVGIRYTGRAALNRDPQDDRLEFTCPHCGTVGSKPARRSRGEYHFTDGFVQDLQGEMSACRGCHRTLRIVPVVMLHDQDETRRFQAFYATELLGSTN